MRILILTGLVLFSSSCDLFKTEKKFEFKKDSVLKEMPLSLSQGKLSLIAGNARCFFGDLDAANFDTKASGKKSFKITVETFSENGAKHLLSKKVNLKTFTKGMSVNANKLKDGLYGVFICSDTKKPCSSSSYLLQPVNQTVFENIDRADGKKIPFKHKVYSANFFAIKNKKVIAPYKVTSLKNLGKQYEEYLSYLFNSDRVAKKVWGKIKKYFEIYMPHPFLMRVDDSEDANKYTKDDILVEIPAMDRKSCDVKVLLDIYKKQRKD